MRFTPVTPSRLAGELARWIDTLPGSHPVVGVDGATEIGATAVADAVAAELAGLNRPAIRASTLWWWRPASLRLELGRTDVDTLLTGWVDAGAMRRELLEPLGDKGSGRILRRLRDPGTDRSIREPRQSAALRAVLLLDGPFLLAAGLPMDAMVHLQVSPATLRRSLPADRQWWLEGFHRYAVEDSPVDRAAAVVAYDHPSAPAIAWADGVRADSSLQAGDRRP